MSNADASEPALHHKVGWFELFYDLVIVAGVGYAAHTFAHHPTWGLGVWIAAWTLIMFVLWLLTAINYNIFPGDFAWRRILGLVQMLAIVVAALGTVADEGLPNWAGFAGLSVAFASVAVMYAVALASGSRESGHLRLLGGVSGLAALVLATGVLLPDDAEWTIGGAPTWIITIGVGIAAVPLFGVSVARLAERLDDEHMSERLGQLVIIVLGESFMSLVSGLGGLSTIPNPLFFVLTFLVVFAIWTLYFLSVMPTGVPRQPHRLQAWVLTHWLLMFGAVGAAAGFAAVTLVPFGESSENAAAEWTTLPLAFVMIALVVLTWLGAGSWTPLVRLHAAVAVMLVALAALGTTVTTGGQNWEIVVGALLVIGDSIAARVMERRTAMANPAAEGV